MKEKHTEAKKRGIPEIQQEYQQNCLKAGHLQYQIRALQKDLDFVNDLLLDLNLEAATLKSKEEAEAKANEPKQEAKLAAVPSAEEVKS